MIVFHSQEKDPHLTHYFEWCWSGKQPTSVTCNKAGTVEDALRRSLQFKETAKKMKDKELVIVRGGKGISSHFPCSLIGNERLTLKYVKPGKKQKQHGNGSVLPRRKGPSNELVMFHVLTKGGKNVVKIMKNPAIKTHVQEITIYGYKGETLKQALRRDGRILSHILKKNCALSHVSTEVNTEMSNLVDDLDGKTYKIILLNKCSPPESLPGSLDDAYMTQNESQRSDSDENQDPQKSDTTMSVNDSTPKKKQKLNDNTASEKIVREITNSNNMQHYLSSQFKLSVKVMKTGVSKLSRIQNLLRVEYGKSAQTFAEVKTMKKLMDLSSNVCQVRIDGRPEGSGFLLFDKFVLTNAHVLKDIYNENRRQLDLRVTVNFSYESLGESEGGQDSGAEVEVEEVAGFEYCQDASGLTYDWALLRLRANDRSPNGLLTHFGFLLPSGEICIIGHPSGGVKKIDSCLIIPPYDRSQVVDKYRPENPVQFITQRFFEELSESVQRNTQVLTYKSCFYFLSSGSPVFDKHCRVVAMHSGGFMCPNEKGVLQHVVEFGCPLSFIIEHMIVQMVQRRRFDVLKAYLACKYAQHQNMMINVKKLVDSRNIIAFKNVVNSSVTENDESLKMFFEFFCLKEEPVPMDIDVV